MKQGFTGKERDGETGLDSFGARHYSGALGRFLSADLPLYDQDAADPLSWNLYSCVRNNPLRYIDPTGRGCVSTQSGHTRTGIPLWTNTNDPRVPGPSCGEIDKQDANGTPAVTVTEVAPPSPLLLAVAQGVRSASPVADARFIAGFYTASVLGGYGLYSYGAFAGELTTLGVGTGAATEGTSALATTIQISKHAAQRMAERGFTRDMIRATIKNGTRYWDPKHGTFNYVLKGGFASGKDALVGMNPVTNIVITILRGTVNVGRMIPF